MRAPRPSQGLPSALFTYALATLACAIATGAFAQAPSPCVVTTNLDSGAGSLRDNITRANTGLCAGNVITFNMTTPLPIQPASLPLPDVTNGTTIDGTTQPGFVANADPDGFNDGGVVITIDGSSLTFGCGLQFIGATVGSAKGLRLQNFNFAGGSGAGVCGKVRVTGSVVRNNAVGVDPSGGAVIGDVGNVNRNRITGNSVAGVFTFSSTVISNNLIDGNAVGITLDCPSRVQIRDRNVITLNTSHGIWIGGSSNNSIQGNFIGVTPSGGSAGNGGHGVLIGDGNECRGPSRNNQAFNNAIAFNSGSGVRVNSDPTGEHVGNIIQGNSLYANAVKSIDLGIGAGILANDAGDGDAGANNRQNHPVPSGISYSVATNTTTVTFDFDTGGGNYTIFGYSNPTLPSKPEARNVLAPTGTYPSGSGFSITFNGAHDHISLGATSVTTGDSSELSPTISLPPPPAPGACVVTTAADSGAGSLREMIGKANASLCTASQITFKIPSPPFIVQLKSPLPDLSVGITIDGTTQPGYGPPTSSSTFSATLVAGIDGSSLAASACGLRFFEPSIVKGLFVQDFSFDVNSAGLCGRLTVTGSHVRGNSIGIDADGGMIGGSLGADRNLIESNVKGVLISLSPSGLNLIHNTIANNTHGFYTDCATGGGLVQNNDFTGNSASALWLKDATGFNIRGNVIGPNGGDGIYIGSFSCIGSHDNVIDGNNTVSGNGRNGVSIRSAATDGNEIAINAIYGNALKNIDLNFPGGPLPNDAGAGDADTGPNRLQNYPVITSLTLSDGILINFTLDSTPSRTFRVRAFSNGSPLKPAGELYRGQADVATNASGVATGSILAASGDHFSLTATDITTRDTSEFSAIFSLPTSKPTPMVSLSSNAMSFGDVRLDTASPTQSVTLTSSGTAAYRITAFGQDATCGTPMCGSGDFSCSTTCGPGTDYAPGATCRIDAQFNPRSQGPAASNIFICDNTSTSPQQVRLSGRGVAAPSAGGLEISPAAFDFGRVLVGQGARATFSIINHANTDATDVRLEVSGDGFELISHNCPATLPRVSACYADVGFIPNQPAPANGELRVTAVLAPSGETVAGAKAASQATASLKGTGFSAAQLSLPESVDFGTFTLRSPPILRTVTAKNAGNAVLTFAAVSVVGPFTLDNRCPLNLAPGASCDLILGFTSATVGDFSGTLNVVANGTDGSRAIALTARAQAIPEPVIVVEPASIGFGNQMIGSTGTAQRVTVRNDGGAVAALGTVGVSRDFTIVATSCGATLDPGATCFADVAMLPLGFGQRSGQLLVNSNAAGSPHPVNLVGTGCRPFTFGSNRLGAAFHCAP